MNFNKERLHRFLERMGWRIPVSLAIAATPFMAIDLTTDNYGAEIAAKLVLIVIAALLLAYNVITRKLTRASKSEKPTE